MFHGVVKSNSTLPSTNKLKYPNHCVNAEISKRRRHNQFVLVSTPCEQNHENFT